jgi:alpha-D-ribose 1-methylphosphonate 5-triphosphate diphosphatase
MSIELVFSNATIVTRHEVFRGSARVVDGIIHDVDSGVIGLNGSIDLEGDFLVPGLVELHTDGLERHIVPRPGVIWPSGLESVMAHDTNIIGAGITTVLDAVAVGDYIGEKNETAMRNKILNLSIAAICQGVDSGLFRSRHFLHLRCEISDPRLRELIQPYCDSPLVKLMSIMDHTPGQRQWTDLSQFRKYYQKRNWSEEQIAGILEGKTKAQRENGEANREFIIRTARERGLPIASHDDTIPDHVDQAVKDGFTISEFPTTKEAAAHAHANNMKTVMGAPNVVRGNSHSGNASALEMARLGFLDALSSDYVPISMIHAAFMLHRRAGLDLPEAVAKVTANPADMLGLKDCGRIEAGLRGDMIRVGLVDDLPIVKNVWRGGQRMI